MSQTNGTVRIRATGETVRYFDSHGAPMTEDRRPPRGSAGFWVRDRRIMSLTSSHVRAIIGSPELFGMSAEQVRSTYIRSEAAELGGMRMSTFDKPDKHGSPDHSSSDTVQTHLNTNR